MSLKSDTGPFAIVPEWVLDIGLSSRAVHLYAVLSRYADRKGEAWPSRSTLGQRLGCKLTSVDRALMELKQAQAVTIQARLDKTGQQTNLYTIRRVTPPSLSVVTPLPMDGDPPSPRVTHRTRTSEREPVNPLGEQSSREAQTRKPRTPDPLYDTYSECTCSHPQTDSERGMWNRGLKEIRAANGTPSEMRARIGAWRMKYPNAQLTPIALAKHWGSLGPPDTVRYVAQPEPPPDFKANTANIRDIRKQMGMGP